MTRSNSGTPLASRGPLVDSPISATVRAGRLGARPVVEEDFSPATDAAAGASSMVLYSPQFPQRPAQRRAVVPHAVQRDFGAPLAMPEG